MHLVITTVDFDDDKDDLSSYVSEHLVVLWIQYFLIIILTF